MASTYDKTITSETLKTDNVDDAGGGSIDVATRVNFGPSGPVGAVAAFGATGTESVFESDGDLLMDADADIILGGTTGGLTTGGGELTIDGATGALTLAAGSQLTAHGVPKILAITVPYTDFTAAATTDFTDYTVESTFDWILLDWFGRQITDFTGGAVTVTEMLIGNNADADKYCPAGQLNVFSGAPAFRGTLVANRGIGIDTFGDHEFITANTIRVTLNTTSGNCADLTAGSFTLYLRYFTVPS